MKTRIISTTCAVVLGTLATLSTSCAPRSKPEPAADIGSDLVNVSTSSSATPTSSPQPIPEGHVLLRHKVAPGCVRRYRVEGKTEYIFSSYTSKNLSISEQVRGNPLPPREQKEVWFVERESGVATGDPRISKVSYQVESFGFRDSVGGEESFECTVRNELDLRKIAGDPRAMLLGAVMEAPVSYHLSMDGKVSDVTLPGSATVELRATYREGLQARYNAFIPEHAVQPGDRWEATVNPAVGFSSLADSEENDLETEAHFVSLEERDGRRLAVIELTIQSTQASDPIILSSHVRVTNERTYGTSRITFDVDAGAPVAEETEICLELVRRIGVGDSMVMMPYRKNQRISAHAVQ